MKFKLLGIFWALMAICLGPWTAGADVFYYASLNNPYNGTNSGSTPQTNEYNYTYTDYPYPGYSLAMGSYAGSVLKAYTHQQYTPPASYTGSPGVAAGPAVAQFLLTDIIISGPTSGTVPVSVNLSINGTLAATTTNTGAGTFEAHAWVTISGGFFSSSDFTGEMEAGSISTAAGTTKSFSATGMLAGFAGGFPGSGSVTTPTFNLSVGSPHAMNLTLSTRTDWLYSIFTPVSASGEATADFYHSLSFATSGDVFNLPDGYTVNSVSGNIVNNRWVGATAPLPSTMLLLGSGLVCLGGWRRLRFSSHHGVRMRTS
jgi:hypothetical protein